MRKIYENVLEKKLRKTVEDNLEGQHGFRPQRGTTEAIFILKMMRSCEYAQHVYIAFVDLLKPFDRLQSKEIWETLEDLTYMIEPSLIRAIKSLYRNCVTSVRTEVREYWLNVTKGVGQGGVATPQLFVLFMDRFMK